MIVAITLEQSGIVLIATIVAVAIAWYVIARVFGSTRLGRRARHFLDAGEADMAPEDKVKYKTRHPGAGGFG